MNVLKLKMATPEYAVYLYYPEGKNEPGELRMDIDAGEVTVISRAAGDNSVGHYAFKAARAIKQCISETKNFPLELTNAWA